MTIYELLTLHGINFHTYLLTLTVADLKKIIADNYFGSVSTKNVAKLADYINDNVRKRSVDVFRSV